MKDRLILHSDCNCFYASVEMLKHPEYRDKPMAVGGDAESRHGIILTANYAAKAYGIKTGMTLVQAKQICPAIVILKPDMELYREYSGMVREIYYDYTDRQQSFGIDECWLDISSPNTTQEDAIVIAKEINRRVREELGITVSVGVSFNKVFAKLASDYKKPDAITTMFRDEYRDKAWPLPVSDLLYVGKSTCKKLNSVGIRTIGELAVTDKNIIQSILGKSGEMLWMFANGYDDSPVETDDSPANVKSVGNSTTACRDLLNNEDARIVIYALADSVAARLREKGLRCRVIEVSIRDCNLVTITRQRKLSGVTDITSEIAKEAYELFLESYDWAKPVRSIGVRAGDLVDNTYSEQMELFCDYSYKEKLKKADLVIDEIRKKFGNASIRRGVAFKDKNLSDIRPDKKK